MQLHIKPLSAFVGSTALLILSVVMIYGLVFLV